MICNEQTVTQVLYATIVWPAYKVALLASTESSPTTTRDHEFNAVTLFLELQSNPKADVVYDSTALGVLLSIMNLALIGLAAFQVRL